MNHGEMSPRSDRIALVTGANQGVGLQAAKELVANGLTVLVGSRQFEPGEAAAKEIGPGAIAMQIDVTDQASITAAAGRIRNEFGRLDLLINNAAISNTRKGSLSLEEYAETSKASNASLEELREVWETNVFGALAVYQAMLPLIRESSDGRIVNVSSGVGSLTTNADPSFPYHTMFGPIYPASKAALNAITLAMMVELEYLEGLANSPEVDIDIVRRSIWASGAVKYFWIPLSMVDAVEQGRTTLNRRPLEEAFAVWAQVVPEIFEFARRCR
jgi:NAD(P)-dependent dehydrogenase (short-subunit alcohol dehydrogenase family)